MISKIITNNISETQKIAEKIALAIKKKTTIALLGNLGSGKTTFTYGIAKGLGIKTKYINSPTYNIVKEYKGRLKLYHIDFYRLSSYDDLENIGFDEIINDENSVCIIEWADKFGKKLFSIDIAIKFKIITEKKRELSIETFL